MMAAYIFVFIANRYKRTKAMGIICTIISVVSILIVNFINTRYLAEAENCQIWQIEYRFVMSLLFSILVVSTALAAKWYRRIFANPVTVFIAGISMNIYIWHQWLAVFLKYDLRIPSWTGADPPNQLGNVKWQWEYLIISTVLSIALATLVTYLIEKPCAKLILKKKK